MEDEELIALKTLRQNLLMKACNLCEELEKQEKTQRKYIVVNDLNTIQNCNNKEETNEKYQQTLCKISQKASDISFEDITRKWLKNNFYQYTTLVVTKRFKFCIKLLVELDRDQEFEIYDINCSYVNIDKCYILEINSWIQNMVEMKNFSLLTSAMSRYTEQNMIREKIINKLKDDNYASSESYTNDVGGIMMLLHSPKDIQQPYLTVHWSIRFLERTWNMQHHFVISALEAGYNFVSENHDLLEEFCKPSLTKQMLIQLWERLCSTIDTHESSNKNQVNDSAK